jgi:hypothetical protein
MSIILLLGFTFLSVPVHSRVIYSGSSYSTYSREAENLFWNPAGMAEEGYLSSVYNYSQITFGCIGLVRKIKDFYLGTGIMFMNSGDLTKTDMTGNSLGNFSYYSLIPVLGGEYKIGDFNIGGKVSIPYSKTDIYDNYGLGLDLGIIYDIKERFYLSIYLRNLGIQIDEFVNEEESFPAELRLGTRYKLNNFNLSLEYSNPLGFSTSLISKVSNNFEFIAGYNGSLRDLSKAGDSDFLTGLSIGFRFYYNKIILDLGAVSYGALGVSKTIAINWKI